MVRLLGSYHIYIYIFATVYRHDLYTHVLTHISFQCVKIAYKSYAYKPRQYKFPKHDYIKIILYIVYVSYDDVSRNPIVLHIIRYIHNMQSLLYCFDAVG